MPSLLALDASLYVGHAFFASPMAKPICQTWKAPDVIWASDDYAPYFLAFERWLTDILTVHAPDVVAFESPIVVQRREGRGNDENNIRRLIGIVSVLELVVHRRNHDLDLGVQCLEINNQTAKAFAGVPGRKPEGMTIGQYKAAMETAMTARGFAVADQHQADACAVGLVAYDSLGYDTP